MSIDDDLRSIQTRISQAQAKKMRATIEQDNAQAKLTQAKKVFEEFGIKDNADAKNVLLELQQNLDSEIEKAKRSLEEAGV